MTTKLPLHELTETIKSELEAKGWKIIDGMVCRPVVPFEEIELSEDDKADRAEWREKWTRLGVWGQNEGAER